MQVRGYGLAAMCSSYRRLLRTDAKQCLRLSGPAADQQLCALLEDLARRWAVTLAAHAHLSCSKCSSLLPRNAACNDLTISASDHHDKHNVLADAMHKMQNVSCVTKIAMACVLLTQYAQTYTMTSALLHKTLWLAC